MNILGLFWSEQLGILLLKILRESAELEFLLRPRWCGFNASRRLNLTVNAVLPGLGDEIISHLNKVGSDAGFHSFCNCLTLRPDFH